MSSSIYLDDDFPINNLSGGGKRKSNSKNDKINRNSNIYTSKHIRESLARTSNSEDKRKGMKGDNKLLKVKNKGK